MKQQYFGLSRLADRDALKARANEVLSMLEQGTL
jgi:hypothetical protein